jgi:hypothetical protein
VLRRTLLFAAALLVFAGSTAAAQESVATEDHVTMCATDSALCESRLQAVLVRLEADPTNAIAVSGRERRPAALGPLYVSMVGLHALDVHSTWRVLNAGGSESNPLVRRIVGSPAGVVAVKAGSSAAVIYAAEKMWKHNRTAAIVMMVGINSAYAAVVAHNYAAGR